MAGGGALDKCGGERLIEKVLYSTLGDGRVKKER